MLLLKKNPMIAFVSKPRSRLCHLAVYLQKSDSTVGCTCEQEYLFINKGLMNGYINSKSEKNLSVTVTLNSHTRYFIGATEVSWSLEREAESQFLHTSSLQRRWHTSRLFKRKIMLLMCTGKLQNDD